MGLEFDDDADFGLDLDLHDENNVDFTQFHVDNTGRARVKLTKWQFLRLFCFSPLKFDQLINHPGDVSDYLS